MSKIGIRLFNRCICDIWYHMKFSVFCYHDLNHCTTTRRLGVITSKCLCAVGNNQNRALQDGQVKGDGEDKTTESMITRSTNASHQSTSQQSQVIKLDPNGESVYKHMNRAEETVALQDPSSSSSPIGVRSDISDLDKPSELCREAVLPSPREPPVPPDPETCCESGCVNCVWIKYADEVKQCYPHDEEKLREILDMIEDYNVKMFVKMDLGL